MKILEIKPKRHLGEIVFCLLWENQSKEIYHAETLVKFDLHVQDEISDERMIEIRDFDQLKKCLQQAIRLLGRRYHGRFELRQKLIQRNFTGRCADLALDTLAANQYLDDSLFAEKFLHDRLLKKKMGERLALNELLKKGISESLARDAVEKIYRTINSSAIASEIARKKWKTICGDEKKKRQKLIDFLIRRGFEYEFSRQIADQISKDE